jgi:hypothetical protein
LLKPTPKHMNRKNKIKAIMPIQKIFGADIFNGVEL